MRNSSKIEIQSAVAKIDWRIRRSLRNRILDEATRNSSDPYLSADSYYAACTIRISRINDLSKLSFSSNYNNIFLNGDLVDNLIDFCHNSKEILKIGKIVIADTDQSFHQDKLKTLLKYAAKIYCTNYVSDSSKKIIGIPIGLESQSYLSAGRTKDFAIKSFKTTSKKRIGILIAWNDETALNSRVESRKILCKSDQSFEVKARIPATLVHKLMFDSLFVACPRGNGLDTHRFWESLYLGAIPVVLRSEALPVHYEWPSLITESWEEIGDLDRKQLEIEYIKRINQRSELIQKSQDLLRSIVGHGGIIGKSNNLH